MNNKVQCSWCGRVTREGVLPISHGCCPSCVETLLAELVAPISQVERTIENVARERRL